MDGMIVVDVDPRMPPIRMRAGAIHTQSWSRLPGS
jgi:hypothetical protein